MARLDRPSWCPYAAVGTQRALDSGAAARCENASVDRVARDIAAVRLLGPVQAVGPDGAITDLPSASQRRLLAVLAINAPRRLRSEWLADLFDVSPGALRTSVSRLRDSIGEVALRTSSTGYFLVADVDALAFGDAVARAAHSDDRLSALRHALDLWTGPFLEEFAGERWADAEIARLTEVHAGTVDDFAETLISATRSSEAVAVLERQTGDYPYRDRSWGLLIQALGASGRRGDALRAYRRYRDLLRDELGTDPSPYVVRIERRVATGWMGLASEPADSVAVETFAIPLPGSFARGVKLFGRGDQLDGLMREVALTADSGQRCVLLLGESGIGKTSLLCELARRVVDADEATVIYGRSDETAVPLEPFRSLIGACVEYAPLDLLAAHVARCGGELGRLAPHLYTRVPTAPEATVSDDATERFVMFEAAADLLRRVAAGRPLVILFDDLQWAEPTALQMLRHLHRALTDAPICMVVGIREPGEQPSDELRSAISELERGQTRRLNLGGLDVVCLRDLLLAAGQGDMSTDAEPLARLLLQQTAGNPLYAGQLVRHWVESDDIDWRSESGPVLRDSVLDIPPNLRALVSNRVRALGQETSEVLGAASVLGLDFSEEALVDLVDRPDSVVGGALDSAESAGLLVDTGSAQRLMQFVHPLVAGALYGELGRSRRSRLHERAARTLEKRVEEPSTTVAVQLARHYGLAGMRAEALTWAARAGDLSLDQLAPTEAAQHFSHALDLAEDLGRSAAERADLMVRLGDAQYRSGLALGLATLERGADLARRSGAYDALTRAVFASDHGIARFGTRARGYLALVEAAVAAADPDDVGTYARLLALLAQCLVSTDQSERRHSTAHEALALAHNSGDPVLLARIAPAVLQALWGTSDTALRSELAAAAVAAAEVSGDPRLEYATQIAAYDIAIESADPLSASRSLQKVRSIAATVGEPRQLWMTGLVEVFEATMAGRLSEADSTAAAVLEQGLEIGAPDAFTWYAGQYFVMGTFAGRHDQLFPIVEEATKQNPDMLVFRLAYGMICEAVGRAEVAREILDEGTASGFAKLARNNMWMTAIIGYAIIAIELADTEAAAQILPLIEPFAAQVSFNGVTSQGPISAYVGKLASLLDDHELAEESLKAALQTAEAFGWQYHKATTLVALAEARYRRSAALDEEALVWLSQAAELCRSHGFVSWQHVIDGLRAASAASQAT